MNRIPMRRLLFLACLLTGIGSLAAEGVKVTPSQQRAWDAVKNGDRAGLQAEIKAGVELNLKNAPEVSFLMLALKSNQFEMIPLLVKGGANLRWGGSGDTTLLQQAVLLNKPQGVTALLKAGAPVDETAGKNSDGTKQGMTALSRAAYHGYFEIVKILVENGANLNHVDALNGTPVSRAWEKKHEQVARYLESFGATNVQSEARANPLVVKRRDPPSKAKPPTSASSSSGGSSSSSENSPEHRPALSDPDDGLFGTRAIPVRPARPIYEINKINILGGPLAELWAAFKAKHAEWGLDDQGHRTNLGKGTAMVGGSTLDRFPSSWLTELYQLGVERKLVPTNPQATFLVAPQGGYAAIAAAEDQIRQAEANEESSRSQAEAAKQTSSTEGDSSGSQAAGRPQ
jgi:hypothetical protein